MIAIPAGSYKNMTSTAAVTTKPAILTGFYVNSTTSGTLVFRDGGSGGTVLGGTITPAIGWYFLPADCPSGLHVTIANTIDVTIVYTVSGGT